MASNRDVMAAAGQWVPTWNATFYTSSITDVAAYGPSRDLVPLFPFCKIVWTLAGTTKSMGFTLWMSYLELKAI